MNVTRGLGALLIIIAGLVIFLVEDSTGGIGFVSGIVMALGVGLLLGWIPFRKKKSK